jgi:hypothetical protein
MLKSPVKEKESAHRSLSAIHIDSGTGTVDHCLSAQAVLTLEAAFVHERFKTVRLTSFSALVHRFRLKNSDNSHYKGYKRSYSMRLISRDSIIQR